MIERTSERACVWPHVMSRHLMPCHLMRCHVTSGQFMLCHVKWCHVMPFRSCHFVACQAMSGRVRSCRARTGQAMPCLVLFWIVLFPLVCPRGSAPQMGGCRTTLAALRRLCASTRSRLPPAGAWAVAVVRAGCEAERDGLCSHGCDQSVGQREVSLSSVECFSATGSSCFRCRAASVHTSRCLA